MTMTPIDQDGRKIRGYAIISKGDVPEKLKIGVWRIPSQSGKGYYTIESHNNVKEDHRQFYACNCLDWKNNMKDCKHIYALRFYLEVKGKVENEAQEELKPAFKIDICPYCKSDKIFKRGIRKNINVRKQIYACKDCKRRFITDIASRTKGNGKIVTLCLDLYFKGISLRKIQDHLLQFYDFEISYVTIQRWIRKFMAIANDYASKAQPQVSGLWHVDEQMIKNNGSYLWVWNCIDAKTRYLIANNVTQSRYNEDAKAIFTKASQYGTPDVVVTDGLHAYPRAIKDSFGWRALVRHVKADGITSKKKNNNMIERYHNTFRERDKVIRGFKGQKSAEFLSESYKTYYNFVKPHMALGGLTPSQVANVTASANRNRWMELLTKN